MREKPWAFTITRNLEKSLLARVSQLTIIIPVRNEQQTITGVLRSLARQDRISDCQIIVVDGGSTDGTADLASAFPFVEVITSAPGLVRQMNNGAKGADGKNLWFLHSDTTLPGNTNIAYILSTFDDPNVVGGACKFQLRGDDLYYRFISSLVNFRAKWMHRPYGDQGIFVRTTVFKQLGGFRQMPCNDLDLFLRMRNFGETRMIPSTVATSARTWQKYGKITTTIWHMKEWLGYEWNRKFGKLPSNSPAENGMSSQNGDKTTHATSQTG